MYLSKSFLFGAKRPSGTSVATPGVSPALAEKSRYRVISVPGGKENVHEIRVQGEFGRLTVKIENVPSERNPRTSQLAAFSAIATLKNLTGSLRVGT
jgi:aspartate dehydrogenase